MTEMIIVLVATIAVFSIFLMVYLIKDRSGNPNKQRSACGRCDCQSSQRQHEHPITHSKQIEKEVRPCSAGRSVDWSASD